MKAKLTCVPETLLIPLWTRAVETGRPDAIIKDEKAVEILPGIDYDFSKFEKSWMSQVGVSVRTELLDKATNAFIKQYAEAVIINLGAGLDTRFARLDDGKIKWYDLDVPEAIELRRNFFQETERYRMIAKSVLDFSWLDDVILSGEPVLLIAEGLLMYFEESEVRAIFEKLAGNFPHAEMLIEMLGPALVGKSRYQDSVSKVAGAQFKWSLKNSEELGTWNESIMFVEEWYFTDYYRSRWGWFGLVTRVPLIKKLMANRIVHIRFEG